MQTKMGTDDLCWKDITCNDGGTGGGGDEAVTFPPCSNQFFMCVINFCQAL